MMFGLEYCSSLKMHEIDQNELNLKVACMDIGFVHIMMQ